MRLSFTPPHKADPIPFEDLHRGRCGAKTHFSSSLSLSPPTGLLSALTLKSRTTREATGPYICIPRAPIMQPWSGPQSARNAAPPQVGGHISGNRPYHSPRVTTGLDRRGLALSRSHSRSASRRYPPNLLYHSSRNISPN